MANWWETPQGRAAWAAANPGKDVDAWARRDRDMATPFYQQAQAMFPGLPEWVVLAYSRGLAEHAGNASLAWQRVRQNESYDKTFAGNRRTDGSLRMTEMEYLATKDAYAQTLRDYGLSANVFNDKFVSLIEGDVSPQEFGQRLDAVWQGVTNNTAETQAKFQQWYGASYNAALSQQQPSVALAMALDPDIGNQVLAKRITFAQISGEADRARFSLGLARTEQLAGRGLTQESARQLYGQAASQLPTLDALAQRYNDRDSTFDLDEFEDAFLGDADQQQRAQGLVQKEQAAFTGQRRVRQDQSGGLSGLNQQ